MQFETVRSEVETDPEARGGKIRDIQDRIVHFVMVISLLIKMLRLSVVATPL